jgi:lysophospholipase L1-like esterase
LKKVIFYFVIFSVALGVTFGVLESVVRVRHWVKYGSPTTIQQFVKDDETGLRIPQASSKNGNIKVNALGFRGPEIPLSKPAGTIRLAFLGGSTTWCAEVSNNESTWPHLVAMELQNKNPSRDFDYVNGGVPGYSTLESVTNLIERVQQTNPDLIFIYHATNDLSYDSRKMAKAQGVFAGKPENPSWLASYSMAWFLIEKNLQLRFRKQQVLLDSSRLLNFEPSELSRDFKKRLKLLIQKSQKISPLVAVATFSHQYRRDQNLEEQMRAAETSIFYMPYMNIDRLFAAFDEYNRVIRQVAKEEEIILIEAENKIPGDNVHFNDSVHFKDPGSQKMAQLVLDGLMTNPQFLDFL